MSTGTVSDTDYEKFLDGSNAEKLASQQRRGALVARKLSWVSGLVAAGSVPETVIMQNLTLKLWLILYVVPFVAILFDLYITGENYGLRRMGAFVRNSRYNTGEREWERFVASRRDVFSAQALPWGSVIILAACFGAILINDRTATTWWLPCLWLLVALALIRLVYVVGSIQLEALDTDSSDSQDTDSNDAQVRENCWASLRRRLGYIVRYIGFVKCSKRILKVRPENYVCPCA